MLVKSLAVLLIYDFLIQITPTFIITIAKNEKESLFDNFFQHGAFNSPFFLRVIHLKTSTVPSGRGLVLKIVVKTVDMGKEESVKKWQKIVKVCKFQLTWTASYLMHALAILLHFTYLKKKNATTISLFLWRRHQSAHSKVSLPSGSFISAWTNTGEGISWNVHIAY